MADIVSPRVRSRMMAGIRGKHTRPELTIRRALHRAGLRYRLHVRDLPGKPDLVFPSRRAVVFINGCFWHAHDCQLFRLPGTRTDFWKEKLEGNRARDARIRRELEALGWRHLTIWECAFRGGASPGFDGVTAHIIRWLREGDGCAEIRGAG